MIRFLRTTLNPASYHGHGRKLPFFEGWYCKLVDASEQHRHAIIPSIFLSEDRARHHAFVQFLDGWTRSKTYHHYLPQEFWAADGVLDLRIGRNHLAPESLSLEIEAPELSVHGQLDFRGVTSWPVTLASPGIMGWYVWVPFMECYHGVVSLDHSIGGVLDAETLN